MHILNILQIGLNNRDGLRHCFIIWWGKRKNTTWTTFSSTVPNAFALPGLGNGNVVHAGSNSLVQQHLSIILSINQPTNVFLEAVSKGLRRRERVKHREVTLTLWPFSICCLNGWEEHPSFQNKSLPWGPGWPIGPGNPAEPSSPLCPASPGGPGIVGHESSTFPGSPGSPGMWNGKVNCRTG